MRFLSRYFLTGILGTFVNIGLFFVLLEIVGIWYLAASITAYLARSFTKYSLLRLWVFKGELGVNARFRWFLSMETLGLLLGTVLIYVFVEWLYLPHLSSLILTICLLYIAMLYGSRYIFASGPKDLQKGGWAI